MAVKALKSSRKRKYSQPDMSMVSVVRKHPKSATHDVRLHFKAMQQALQSDIPSGSGGSLRRGSWPPLPGTCPASGSPCALVPGPAGGLGTCSRPGRPRALRCASSGAAPLCAVAWPCDTCKHDSAFQISEGILASVMPILRLESINAARYIIHARNIISSVHKCMKRWTAASGNFRQHIARRVRHMHTTISCSHDKIGLEKTSCVCHAAVWG